MTLEEGQHVFGGAFSWLRKRLYFHSRSPRGSRMLPEAGWPLAATGEHLPDNATMSSGFDARRFFSYLFIFAIALVFILQFGPGSRGCNAPLTPSVKDAAARVNGTGIP